MELLMKKLVLIGIGLAALVFTGTALAYSHVLFLLTLEYSDFNNVSKNIYIDPALEKMSMTIFLLCLINQKQSLQINMAHSQRCQ